MERWDAIVVGAGLSGLTCAFELADAGRTVLLLEAKPWVGGRTASWNDKGMEIESGFHRFRGIYKALPTLLQRAGLDLDAVVEWQYAVELHDREHLPRQYGIAPRYRPAAALRTLLARDPLFQARDKASLLTLLLKGVAGYTLGPDRLDAESVLHLADRAGVTPDARERFVLPLTRGVFFLPPENYSALAFMMPLAQSLRRLLHMRTGVFRGGMTTVMAEPLAEAIVKRGGSLRTGAQVSALRYEAGRVTGVELQNESLLARHVVVATSLGAAKTLLAPLQDSSLAALLQLPTTPAVSLQMALDMPALPHALPSFSTDSGVIAFAEQSSSTFRSPAAGGRLSLVLGEPEQLLNMQDAEILERALTKLKALGLCEASRVLDYRVLRLPADFCSVRPGFLQCQPDQATSVPGLVLAGDYTRQPFLSTMEGAVLAGQKAAEVLLAPPSP